MVDFQRSAKPRNYLARSEQWRLLLLVLSLGLVFVLMIEARRPENWHWLTGAGAVDGGPGPSGSAPQKQPLRAPVGTPSEEAAADGTASPEGSSPDATAARRYFTGVRPQYLEAIRDDTTFRSEERHAWFSLLDVLNNTDEAALQRASTGPVAFAQLLQQSDDYRGELVSLSGTIRRTVLLKAPGNDSQIERYYQTVFQPADDRTELMFVYCLNLPEGFPEGRNVSAEVKVTGFYFKRWVYRAQDTVRTAPVLLAKTVRWQKGPLPAKPTAADPVPWLLPVAVAAVLSLLVAAYLYTGTRLARRQRATLPAQLDRLPEAEPALAGRLRADARTEERAGE